MAFGQLAKLHARAIGAWRSAKVLELFIRVRLTASIVSISSTSDRSQDRHVRETETTYEALCPGPA